MLKKTLRYLSITVFVVFSFAFFSTAAFFLLIMTGPRSVPYFPMQIEKVLNELSPDLKVKVDDTILKWEGKKDGLGIHITNVSVRDKSGKEIASFPDVKAKLDMYRLVFGIVELKDLIIDKSELNFNLRSADGAEAMTDIGPPVMTAYQEFLTNIISTIEKNGRKIPLRNLTFREAKIYIHNGKQDIAWNMEKISVRFFLENDEVNFGINAIGKISGVKSKFQADGYIKDKDKLQIKASFSDISPVIIMDLTAKYPWLENMPILIGGNVVALLDPDGKARNIDFRLSAKPGTAGSLMKTRFDTTGSLKFHDNVDGQYYVPELHMKVVAGNLPMNDLSKFWPPELASDSREWVTNRITKGVYKRAVADINIMPANFISKDLPPDAISAVVEFENGKVDYISGLPMLENSDGVVEFKTDSMDLFLTDAKAAESELESARISIEALDSHRPVMSIDGRIKGKASDLMLFTDSFSLSRKQRGGQERKNNSKEIKISGSADTRLELQFPLLKDLEMDQVRVKVNSYLSNISIPSLRENIGISDGDLTLFVDNDKINITGNAKLNSVPVDVTYNQDFRPEAEYDEKYTIKARVKPAEFANFGITIPDILKDQIGVDISVESIGKNSGIKGVFNLTDAIIEADLIGLKKSAGVPASLYFVLEDNYGQPVKIPSFELASEGVEITGYAEIEKEGKKKVNLDKVKYGKNDFEMYLYSDKPGSYDFKIKGKAVDISPAIKNLSGSNKDLDNKDNFALKLDVGKLYLANDVELNSVGISLKCGETCSEMNLSGQFPDKEPLIIKFETNNDKTARVLNLDSDNAGLFFKGFGISEYIKGGKLHIDGQAGNSKDDSLNGGLIIKGFKVRKAPVLAKILVLGSLTGILNLLEGEGIAFDKAEGRYLFEKNLLTLKGVKTSGSSIGITADGYIKTDTKELDIDGAVIPAYFLNSLLGNIPLVGDVFVGKEGEGLIATRYSVEGSSENPDVTVNPLSILTPGILRNIWGGKAGEIQKKGEGD